MQTFSSVQFWPIDPRVQEVRLLDIAHSLSNQCRFAGHVNSFYSVAEHSVRVSYACAAKDALWGLLHDATEAYLVDVPTPVKSQLSEYLRYERALQDVICQRFGLGLTMPPSVHHADRVLLATEARDIMGPRPAAWFEMPDPLREVIVPWSPREAKERFCKRFYQLTDAALGHSEGPIHVG